MTGSPELLVRLSHFQKGQLNRAHTITWLHTLRGINTSSSRMRPPRVLANVQKPPGTTLSGPPRGLQRPRCPGSALPSGPPAPAMSRVRPPSGPPAPARSRVRPRSGGSCAREVPGPQRPSLRSRGGRGQVRPALSPKLPHRITSPRDVPRTATRRSQPRRRPKDLASHPENWVRAAQVPESLTL